MERNYGYRNKYKNFDRKNLKCHGEENDKQQILLGLKEELVKK